MIEQIQFTLKDVSPKLIKNAHILQSSQFDQFYDFNIQIIGIFFIIEQKDETSHLAKSLLYAAMNEEDNLCSYIFFIFSIGIEYSPFSIEAAFKAIGDFSDLLSTLQDQLVYFIKLFFSCQPFTLF